ncbi:MAG: ATP-binding protein [Candidatus Methanomethylophilaceae archaeon]|nr:ATP-binding protein [Candidatus Methanomethylophilaceae archaeon]MBR6203571.1 ATP-binding protein [Candidatus Methanomethylophilaceae archaeon]
MMEDLRTEFKREWSREHLRNVAAFANTDGGTLYIGLADDGTPIGVKDIEKA